MVSPPCSFPSFMVPASWCNRRQGLLFMGASGMGSGSVNEPAPGGTPSDSPGSMPDPGTGTGPGQGAGSGSGSGAGAGDGRVRCCPNCGEPLVLRRSRNGYLLGCPNYPLCDHVESAPVQGVATIRILQDCPCPECGAPLAVKKSRYGMFVGCTAYPDCSFIHNSQKDELSIPCPQCGVGVLRHRTTKFGRSFYSCSNFRNCRFTVSHTPVEHPCPKCGFPIMIRRRSSRGEFLQCPSRSCRHRVSPGAGES